MEIVTDSYKTTYLKNASHMQGLCLTQYFESFLPPLYMPPPYPIAALHGILSKVSSFSTDA